MVPFGSGVGGVYPCVPVSSADVAAMMERKRADVGTCREHQDALSRRATLLLPSVCHYCSVQLTVYNSVCGRLYSVFVFIATILVCRPDLSACLWRRPSGDSRPMLYFSSSLTELRMLMASVFSTQIDQLQCSCSSYAKNGKNGTKLVAFDVWTFHIRGTDSHTPVEPGSTILTSFRPSCCKYADHEYC